MAIDTRIHVTKASAMVLREYAQTPSTFETTIVLEVAHEQGGGFSLSERMLATPLVTNYDAVGNGGPDSWSERFDLADWVFFIARREGTGGRQCI